MSIAGTPQNMAFGFAIAGFMLSLENVAFRVRRGELKMADAAGLIQHCRESLAAPETKFPGDPEVIKIANTGLQLAERLLQTLAAQKSGEGAH